MKRPLKKNLIFLAIAIFFGCRIIDDAVIAAEPLKDDQIIRTTPQENPKEKLIFIKNHFEKNREYVGVVNDEDFKYILVGSWLVPPEGSIEFGNDGHYKALNEKENIAVCGFWSFYDGKLRLSSDKKKWEILSIKKYCLHFSATRRNRGNAYGLTVLFDKKICGMACGISVDFYTKSNGQEAK